MHIQDFHSKLTSRNEESHLFEALRSLSRIEDPRAMLEEIVVPTSDWPNWPALDAHASHAASAGV